MAVPWPQKHDILAKISLKRPSAEIPTGSNGAGDGQRREAPQLGGCETPGSAREGGLHVQVLLQAAIMDQSRMVAEVLGGSGF